LLKSERSWREKLRLLLGAGLAGIVVGWLLGVTGICPVVKRIWTPSWALLSSGWVLVLLAGFYWLIDVKGKVNWSYGLRAVGMNSIAMYTMTHLWDSFLASSFKVHLGWNVLSALPEPVLTTAVYFLAWCVLWWFCIWMDRKRLYIRI
jgi:predicted acyltransferase